MAGVSAATVSYVLNDRGNISEATRRKVLEIVQKVNYKPNNIAKSLKTNKTSTIGVIVEDITVFNAPEIIDGINESAEEQGLSIILTNLRIHKRIGNNFKDIDRYRDTITTVANDLLSKQVDGILYVGVHTRDVTGFIDINRPVVYLYSYTTLETDYSVNYDDELAAYEATNYLIQLGHRKIAIISGLMDSNNSRSRFNGYYKAFMEQSLIFEPSYIKTGDWEFHSGYLLCKELLSHSARPSAIMAMNDLMAGGAIQACKEAGLEIPRDISVIGFDNREFSAFITPKLTTMSLPLREMGNKSIEIISGLVNNKMPSENKFSFKCKMVVRESVGVASS